MTKRGTKNIGASVRARLLQIAHAEKRDYLVVLQRFALERLLHRLTLSAHAATDPIKAKQWLAFCRRAGVSDAPELAAVVSIIEPALMGASATVRGGG